MTNATAKKVAKHTRVKDVNKEHDSQRKCGWGGRPGAGTNISIYTALGIFKELTKEPGSFLKCRGEAVTADNGALKSRGGRAEMRPGAE